MWFEAHHTLLFSPDLGFDEQGASQWRWQVCSIATDLASQDEV